MSKVTAVVSFDELLPFDIQPLAEGRHLQSFIRIELWTCVRGTLKRPKLKGLGRLLVTNGQSKEICTFLTCHEGRLSTTLLLCVRETLTGGCRISGVYRHMNVLRACWCVCWIGQNNFRSCHRQWWDSIVACHSIVMSVAAGGQKESVRKASI